MNREQRRLEERRHRLVQRAAVQRAMLAESVAPWRPRLALVDQGIAAFCYLVRRPVLVAGAVAAIALMRPRRAGRWLQRGWLMWQLGRTLRGSGITGKP